MTTPPILIPWRSLAGAVPEFVQWYIATHGPIPDDDPGVDEARWESLRAEYDKAQR